MIPRIVTPLLLLGALTVGLLPGLVLAHGPRLRGAELDATGTVSGTTGNIPQQWRWYTVGLQPGTVTVSATVQSCARALLAPTCGLFLDLLHRKKLLQSASGACYRKQRGCHATVQLSYHIARQGAYYILATGAGGGPVTFSMRLNGNIYPLHCHTYC